MITPNEMLDKACFLNITPKEDNKEQETEIHKVASQLARYCATYTFKGSWSLLASASSEVTSAMCSPKQEVRNILVTQAEDHYKKAEDERPGEWDEGTCMQATYQVVAAARDLVDREAAQ